MVDVEEQQNSCGKAPFLVRSFLTASNSPRSRSAHVIDPKTGPSCCRPRRGGRRKRKNEAPATSRGLNDDASAAVTGFVIKTGLPVRRQRLLAGRSARRG